MENRTGSFRGRVTLTYRALWIASGWGVLCALCPAWLAAAEESWLFSPYRIHVWVASDYPQRFTPQLLDDINRTVVHRSGIVAGPAWRCQVELAPGGLAVEMSRGLDRIAPARLREVMQAGHGDRSDPLPDKIMLVSVRRPEGIPELAVREWDYRTEVLGPIVTRQCGQQATLAWHCADAIFAAFAPIARIDDVTGTTAVVRFRAAGLAEELPTDGASSAAVTEGRILSAVIRQNDRYGKPRPGGIRPVEWTLLVVRQPNPWRTECQVLTANRGYLGGRSSSRIERLAIGVRTPLATTDLELRSRDEQQRPLVGYEIYAKDADGETRFLGHTDWRGRLTVSPHDGQVRVLYVRSGGTLLARLPLLPGQTDVAVARLVDDQKRLQAEALVRSLQAAIIDLIAQRELLAARIRQAIQQAKWDEAQQLVDRLRSLPTVTDIRQRIDRGRQETATDNTKIQAVIDKMFLEVQTFVLQKIDPNLVDKLSTELARARAGRRS